LRYEFPEIDLDTVCGSGTYIRTLGLDLALAAGSTAVMSHLCRLTVGSFEYANAISIDQLREGDLQSMLTAPTVGIEHLPRLTIDPKDSVRLGHGLCLEGEPSAGELNLDHAIPNGIEVAAVNQKGELRAILRQKNGVWCPYRVFPMS